MSKLVEIFETRDYGIFKHLKGNRDVTNKRVAIIKDSIKEVGYISNPIIVNEKMEVIDGQGRLEALRQLDMPVEYRVINNIGIAECRAMNLKPTSWTLEDFVKSYADYGYIGYKRLLELNSLYKLSLPVIYNICQKTITVGGSVDAIRSGTFEMSDADYERTKEICEYVAEYKDIQKKIGGRKELFFGIIAWIAQQVGVNRGRLLTSLTQQASTMPPVAKTEHTLKEISEAYNRGYSKTNRRYFDYEWISRACNRKEE